MTEQEPARSGRGPSRVVLLTTILTLAAVVIAGIALARDYFGWQRTKPTTEGTGSTVEGSGSGRTAPGGPVATSPTIPAPADGPPKRIKLDTLPVIGGATNLVALPRALATTPGYERPIVIACPQNAGIDRQREIRYQLNRAFVELTATIRPYFAPPEDRASKVFVTAQIAVRQADDRVLRPIQGQQNDARMATPAELTASVEQADELIIRVQCQAPTGFVILTDASLTVG